uniref:Uncharacterized protein n=1 Tax=Rhizophora mucronata TaxID=61149 RepID=A0A2P2J6E9_RHIMU
MPRFSSIHNWLSLAAPEYIIVSVFHFLNQSFPVRFENEALLCKPLQRKNGNALRTWTIFTDAHAIYQDYNFVILHCKGNSWKTQ